MNNTKKSRLLTLVAGLALALLGKQVFAMETGLYQAPDISKFILIDEKDSDGDRDGVKETHIRYYVNAARDSVFSMTTKHRLWAWSLESHTASDAANLKYHYVIRDSDCDGSFDERYRMDEEFHVPDCLK